MSLITDYPLWYLPLCIALGVVCSYILYKPKNGLEDISSGLLWFLSGTRFLVITLLAFFLLSPLLKLITNSIEKPVLIFATDNSQSIVLNKDSLFYKKEFVNQYNILIEELGNKYEVKKFTFGDKVSDKSKLDFTEKQTDFSLLFNELETSYSNTNVGALVIASDGLFNKGVNPVYASAKLNFPIYTIALGDTSVKKDLILEQVQNNRIAFLGNKFPIKVAIKSDKLQGKKFQLKVVGKNGSEQTKDFTITKNADDFEHTFELEAKEVGIQKYTVLVSNLEGEASYVNNRKTVFIDVIDSRQKVLILAAVPHPDVAAIKIAITGNENYEVESYLIDNFKKPIDKYNLVILHQLPSKYNSAIDVIDEIEAKKIASLYIIGSSSSLNLYSQQNMGLAIRGKNNSINRVVSKLNKDFSLFTLDENFEQNLSMLPPLQAPFGEYIASKNASVLLKQKIGSIETDKPLVLFSEKNDIKVGTIAGEGLWRWKLIDYSQNKNNNWFNGFVSKLVQYLAVKVDKSHFRISSKNNFDENENIQFKAEVYNDSYELITQPEISLNIKSSDNKDYNFTFSKTEKSYLLDVGKLPVDDYSYISKVKLGVKTLTEKGQFSVAPIVIEAINTTANHNLLQQIAFGNSGEMVSPDNLKKIKELINNREDIADIIYEDKSFEEFINLKWIFFLLIALLSLEWLVRKREGGY